MAPGSRPDDPVRGLAPCLILPWMLQSGAYFGHIRSAASDAPVRGTGFSPGRSSPGASAVLLPAPDAPIRGVFLSYSLHCLGRSSPRHRVHPRRSSPGASAVLHSSPVAPTRGGFLWYSLRRLGRSSPWHRVHPRTIQSGGQSCASFRPGSSILGRLFVVFPPLPRTLQSVAPGSPPDDPIRGLGPCSHSPRMLLFGASCFFLSLLTSVFTCAVLCCFVCLFFSRAHCRYSSPALPAPLCFPRPSPPLCPQSSLPLLPFSPFVVALLGHALKLLVSTRACCYVLGRAHTFFLLLPFLPLFSCIVPLFVPSLVACTLCCLCLPLVLSSFVCLGHTHKLLLLSLQFATILIFHSIIRFALLPHAFYVCLHV